LVIILHLISALILFMAHGISIGVALWLRRERQPERLRALLELSESSKMPVRVSLVVLLLSGIAGGFMLNWWRMGWIWVSLALLVLITVVMMRGVSPYFNKLRKATGAAYTEGRKRQPAGEASPTDLEALLGTAHHMTIMTVIGIGILAVIVYLMMAKPF
jgi:amino acid transporter